MIFIAYIGVPSVTVVKYLLAKAGDSGDTRDEALIPGSGRSPGVGNGNPLHCSCLENPMDRGTWWATVHEVVESDTAKAMQPAHPHV